MKKSELRKLQKEWDDKLKAEGLGPIYYANGRYKKAVREKTQEKIENGEAEHMSIIYDQLRCFFYATNFKSLFKRRVLDKKIREKWTAEEVEDIFLCFINGETVSNICRKYNKNRAVIYPVIKEVLAYAKKNSLHIKLEAKQWIENWSVNKNFGNSKGVNKNICKKCGSKYYQGAKGTTFDFCEECVIIRKFHTKDGIKIEIVLKE